MHVYMNVKRNLAIANRSPDSSAHTVTTVNFQGGGEFFTVEEAYGTPVVAATPVSINFSLG